MQPPLNDRNEKVWWQMTLSPKEIAKLNEDYDKLKDHGLAKEIKTTREGKPYFEKFQKPVVSLDFWREVYW